MKGGRPLIIHKDSKSIEVLSGFPNENFGNYENVFIVDDNSNLAMKIKRHMPYFDFVLDDEGNLIDIMPTERPPSPPPEPTETELLSEYIVDVDFRVAMLELGL